MYHNNILQGLYLDGNKCITDGSIDHLLLMLSHNSSLKILRLSNCNLSEKRKHILRQMKQSENAFSLVT
jgi:hypothetical protein